ncbi:hypothetical protein ACVWZA_002095 [Sphingomonas sp. UYAg733]
MRLVLPAIILASIMGHPASASPTDCRQFLAGHWVGKGKVEGFGKPVQVDNDYSYSKDGSFATINRYLGKNGRWNKQRLVGTWKVVAGKGANECTLTLTGTGVSMGSSSTSDFSIIDSDTFRSLGFDMKRVRQ